MAIATYFTRKDCENSIKKTKNKKLINAYDIIIACCNEIDILRDKLEKYDCV